MDSLFQNVVIILISQTMLTTGIDLLQFGSTTSWLVLTLLSLLHMSVFMPHSLKPYPYPWHWFLLLFLAPRNFLFFFKVNVFEYLSLSHFILDSSVCVRENSCAWSTSAWHVSGSPAVLLLPHPHAGETLLELVERLGLWTPGTRDVSRAAVRQWTQRRTTSALVSASPLSRCVILRISLNLSESSSTHVDKSATS